jgi:hypothetical protein
MSSPEEWEVGDAISTFFHPKESLNVALDLARRLNIETLVNALEELKIPEVWPGCKDWCDFHDKLKALIVQERDFAHGWEFSTEQRRSLDSYITATHLLVECLDVAYVTDREGIEDRLLRPPRKDDHAG